MINFCWHKRMVLKLLIDLLSNTVLKTRREWCRCVTDISPNPQKGQQLERFLSSTVDSGGLRRATVGSWTVTRGPLCWGAADGGGGCACEGWAYRKSLYHPLTLTVTPKLLWKNEVFTNKKIISHFPKDNGQHLNYTNSLHANQDETTKVPTDSF